MANFYLELARKVLEIAQQPLTAQQILRRALSADLIPETYRMRAKTPHKTIHARLAESIRKEGTKSPFYRFSRGTFGLKTNLLNLEYRQAFGKEYKAPIRKKEISSENILCIPRHALEIDSVSGFFPSEIFNRHIASSNSLVFLPRRKIEKDFAFKQIVTYVAVIKGGQVLCYERGTFSSTGDELIGRKSIGFGGHINEYDLDLFSEDKLGIETNARRELYEELNLFSERDIGSGPTIVGVINDNSTLEGNKHIAIAMVYICNETKDPTKGELEIRNLHWKQIRSLPNDLSSFEIWSQIFLRFLVEEFSARLHAKR